VAKILQESGKNGKSLQNPKHALIAYAVAIVAIPFRLKLPDKV